MDGNKVPRPAGKAGPPVGSYTHTGPSDRKRRPSWLVKDRRLQEWRGTIRQRRQAYGPSTGHATAACRPRRTTPTVGRTTDACSQGILDGRFFSRIASCSFCGRLAGENGNRDEVGLGPLRDCRQKYGAEESSERVHLIRPAYPHQRVSGLATIQQ